MSSTTAEPRDNFSSWMGVLSAWGEYAVRAADFLGEPSGSYDDVRTGAFFTNLASRTGLVDFQDVMYQQHPTLRIFLIGLLLGVVALLGGAVPVAIFACGTGGRIPFPKGTTSPRCCLVGCVFLGLLAFFASADLTIMMASQVTLTDAMRRLPGVFQLAVTELRRYTNRTVDELLLELAGPDAAVSGNVKSFLYGVMPNETVTRVFSINCLAAFANDSIATRVKHCKNIPARMFLPGAVVPDTRDVIREDLQLQLNRTLASIDRLEASIVRFERRTRIWSKVVIVDSVATPVVMTLLCMTIALLSFGVTTGVWSCVTSIRAHVQTLRHTTVAMLAIATLVMLFLSLATPLLMIGSSVGCLAECYVCAPYKSSTFARLNKLAKMAWPPADRGLLFTVLNPEVVLTRCSGGGRSIAALGQSARSTVMPTTVRTNHGAASSLIDLSIRQTTAGNCKPLFDATRKVLDLFCDDFLHNQLGIALSLAVAIALLIVALPTVLMLSHFFCTMIEESATDSNAEETRSKRNRHSKASREQLFADDGSFCYSSGRPASSAALQCRVHRPRRPYSHCLPIVGKTWRLPLSDDEEESVDVIDGVNNGSMRGDDDSSSLISAKHTTAMKVRALPTVKNVEISERSMPYHESPLLFDSPPPRVPLAATPYGETMSPPEIRSSSPLINEYFPRLSFSGQPFRRFRSRFTFPGKVSQKTSLVTIEEESEPTSGSEFSMITALSAVSEEGNFPKSSAPTDQSGGDDDDFNDDTVVWSCHSCLPSPSEDCHSSA
ncbi:hypothetical protein V5799_015336 [Amblyomma americanum]|uniref:Uncharacterized protein n=1 Tax=Amblyomma americanum TaxID=6943 RepID=A0AAQ4E0F9_AMBAM